ncbi:MAG: radical SAM protein [Pseudomonadales bacterium]|nr:radical SAM protein [Pseudomonadales bacterium]MCP5183286.1 radical SAM protein [Pseudomonadales bacterium]
MTRAIRPHLFYGQTQSLCEICLHPAATKIIIEGNEVYFLKRCVTHGVQRTLVSTDAEYYRRCRDWLKPGDLPMTFLSRTEFGCPLDCGLCPDHEQHSCLALIEINDHCNLTCPVCFADSAPQRAHQLDLPVIERMLDLLVRSEGEPDLLQISGGEPTLHPRILDVLRAAKKRPIRHLMLNTNGLRLAREPDFAKQLAEFTPGFEIYLQFDSLERDALLQIRGADLRGIRQQALENLERNNIATTLVAVLKKGVNDQEIGDIVRHALTWNCVRGVTFQPIQDTGRNQAFDKNRDRVLLSDIRRGLIEQNTGFDAADIIPLPCNPEAITIGYALRDGRRITPITSLLPRELLVGEGPNTIAYEKYPALKERLFQLMSLSAAGEATDLKLRELLCCLPQFEVPDALGYDRVFRVLGIQFLDRYNFCVAQVKRSCIHFVTPQERIIPFDTYNLFYRDGTDRRLRRELGLDAAGRSSSIPLRELAD